MLTSSLAGFDDDLTVLRQGPSQMFNPRTQQAPWNGLKAPFNWEALLGLMPLLEDGHGCPVLAPAGGQLSKLWNVITKLPGWISSSKGQHTSLSRPVKWPQSVTCHTILGSFTLWRAEGRFAWCTAGLSSRIIQSMFWTITGSSQVMVPAGPARAEARLPLGG